MSAEAALHGQVHYKEQLKLMRASTAAEWTFDALAWVWDFLRAPPARIESIDEATPSRPRYYGAFYC